MKTIKYILFLTLAIFAFGCSTSTTLKSFEQAQEGNYKISYSFSASKSALESATKAALLDRGWSVISDNGGVMKASLDSHGVSGRLLITCVDNSVCFDSTGSTSDGKPIVPIRWIDMLKKSIAKNLKI